MSLFSGFYKLSPEERLEQLEELKLIDSVKKVTLPEELAMTMSENYLFNFELPLGVAVNFSVNDKQYVVPMVIEEPSVVAAASNAAKILQSFTGVFPKRELIGQIIITDISDSDRIIDRLNKHKEYLLEQARSVNLSMIKRGGGPKDIFFDQYQGAVSLYLTYDSCDAMGANAINTTLEHLTSYVESLIDSPVLMAILSNYNPDATVKVTSQVSFKDLGSNPEAGFELAKRIVAASEYAKLDPYRAVTHNKGIMNGIDALLLATGNDFRAVEAACHAFASREGSYQGLSDWSLNLSGQQLVGHLELPINLATLGGTIGVNPAAQWSLDLLGRPSAKELSILACSVGLASNFAALKALVSEGIQRGHMSLQSRVLAAQAGAMGAEIDDLSRQLNQSGQINRQQASHLLNKMRRKEM
ncbi:hydroxymethylglutaryl-CoA reductase, degradative [Hutsoniella sourekii]